MNRKPRWFHCKLWFCGIWGTSSYTHPNLKVEMYVKAVHNSKPARASSSPRRIEEFDSRVSSSGTVCRLTDSVCTGLPRSDQAGCDAVASDLYVCRMQSAYNISVLKMSNPLESLQIDQDIARASTLPAQLYF